MGFVFAGDTLVAIKESVSALCLAELLLLTGLFQVSRHAVITKVSFAISRSDITRLNFNRM